MFKKLSKKLKHKSYLKSQSRGFKLGFKNAQKYYNVSYMIHNNPFDPAHVFYEDYFDGICYARELGLINKKES